MHDFPDNDGAAIEGRGRFRFSLRTVLIIMTVVSIVLFLLLPAPTIVATVGLYLTQTLLVTFFSAGAMYASANLKAFCRGAFIPSLFCYIFIIWYMVQFSVEFDLRDLSSLKELGDFVPVQRRVTVVFAVLSVSAGLPTLVFKWLVAPERRT